VQTSFVPIVRPQSTYPLVRFDSIGYINRFTSKKMMYPCQKSITVKSRHFVMRSKATSRYDTFSSKLTVIACLILIIASSSSDSRRYSFLVSGKYICDDLGDCRVTCERHCNEEAPERDVDSNGDGVPGKCDVNKHANVVLMSRSRGEKNL
jgi:hypothetical protein